MIYILLPVHNRIEVTRSFISCLARQTYDNYHLILIDDGSSDGTAEMVAENIKNLTIITGQGSWWWAGCLQQGFNWLKLRASDNDIVLIMNDDVTFSHDFLGKALSLLESYDGMLLPQVYDPKTGETKETGVEADFNKLIFKTASMPDKINCLPTRGLFMRMRIIKMVGDFHPRVLPHYLSDYEYTIRAHRMGVHLQTAHDLLISFDEGTTGFRSFEGLSFKTYLSRIFSIKSAVNPFYWSMFVFLTAPIARIPFLAVKVWLRFIKSFLILTTSKFIVK